MVKSITTRSIIASAKNRGWNVTVLDDDQDLYEIALSDERRFLVKNISSNKSGRLNSTIAEKKDLFYKLAVMIDVPVPDSIVVKSCNEVAIDFLKQHEKIVVKPTDQAHGNGVTIDVLNVDDLKRAFDVATSYSAGVILQQQVEGSDYRLLFIGKKFAAAAIREPAFVFGDGEHTIEELIAIENNSASRGPGYETRLSFIDAARSRDYLRDDYYSIPKEGVKTRVIGTANIGQGGVSVDVTDSIDGQLISIGQRVVDYLDMGLCGVDIMYSPGQKPYLIEINAAPSLGLHEFPYVGKPRNTPDAFLDWLTS